MVSFHFKQLLCMFEQHAMHAIKNICKIYATCTHVLSINPPPKKGPSLKLHNSDK